MARYKKDHTAEEKKLADLEAAWNAQQNPEDPKDPKEESEPKDPKGAKEPKGEISQEEATFKQRYGDLRTHQQKEKEKYDAKVAELEAKIEDLAKKGIDMPAISSKEEAEAWLKEYPDVAKVVRWIAADMTQGVKEEVKKATSDLEAIKLEAEKRKAYAELLKVHKDFPDQIKKPEFRTWLDGKPEWMKEVLVKGTDAESASDIMDLFKIHIGADTKKEDVKRAAETVSKPTSQAPTDSKNEVVYSESYVDKMSRSNKTWFADHEDKIMTAIREGKFNYDLSGAAQ